MNVRTHQNYVSTLKHNCNVISIGHFNKFTIKKTHCRGPILKDNYTACKSIVFFNIQNPSPNPGNSTFDGEYNEEESAASFAAALAEWRQAKKGAQQNEARKDGEI